MSFGLCLAGGGVKGAAHIGVLKALEEKNIKIDYISGASSGSIVAALYASGYSPDEIYSIFKKYAHKIKYVDFRNIFKCIYGLLFKRQIIINGLNTGNIIEKIIDKSCNSKGIVKISDIKKPLLIPCIDLHTGKIYFFVSTLKRTAFSDEIIYSDNITIGKAVRASCSYPGIFSPCKYKNTELIDGGTRENVPWKGTKQMGADKVLSVIFEKDINTNCCKNIIDVLSNSLEILCHELSNYELSDADYLLKIKTKNVSLLNVKKIDELYNLGYEITKKNIDYITKIFVKK